MTTLVVTNDFPPRIGGIESFVAQACRFLDDDVAVLTSTAPGAGRWDADAGYRIERLPGPLLPTPAVARAAVDLLRRSGADRVLFGAAAPLALLAPTLRVAGARRIVALTHGHETWWAALPGSRALLRRIGDEVDVLTTISDYVQDRIAPALSPAGRAKLVRLPPPVDLDVFTPAADRALRAPTRVDELGPATLAQLRNPAAGADRHTRAAPRRVLGVGRMVRRKGFDTLLRAWQLLGITTATSAPAATTAATSAETTAARSAATERRYELELVGDGPERANLERQSRRAQLAGVTFSGARDQAGVLAALRRCDVFAFPVRTRLGGLDSEGLGLAPLEAAACGLPVVVGRSGGAPETVRHGHTGYVIDPDDPYELAARLADLLTDPERADAMGAAGRGFVAERYGAEHARRVLRTALDLPGVATV